MRQALRISAILAVAGVVTAVFAGSSTAQPVDTEAASTQAAAVPEEVHTDTVYVTGTAKDGSTTVTIYDPAPTGGWA
ncbi:hypothetical protein [Kribbella sp. NPDC048915]|uniref:hypothetical protein n=1 Tax=Kribbella sp. NPDC048915 TaxID=3155148 RepID=UPI0033C6D4BE